MRMKGNELKMSKLGGQSKPASGVRQQLLFKTALLSISLLTGSATAITGMLPLLTAVFPNQSSSMLESLVTSSSLTIFLFTLLSSHVSKLIGHKRTVQLGISLAVVAGVLPCFLSNFLLILICRLIFGAGIGLFTPLAISLISLFFSGDQRASLLGYQIGVTALGNSFMILISGFLMSIRWNWGFLVYLTAIPILCLFSKLIPEPPALASSTSDKRTYDKKGLNTTIYLYVLLCFSTFLIIWAVQIKLPELLIQKGIGTSALASLILSLMNLGGLVAGLLFGKAFIFLRRRLLVCSYLLAAAGLIVLSIADSFLLVASVAVFFNFIYSFTGPYIITKVNEIAAPEQLTLVTALLSVSMTSSQFLTPFFWNGLGRLTGKNTAADITLLAGVGALLIAFVLTLQMKKKWK